jgi:predicted nucleic acid-binding protein
VTLVVDASVAVKWFRAEADSAAARVVRAGGERVVAPELVLAEVLNAGWSAARRGQFTPAQYADLAGNVARFFDQLVPLRGLLPRTAEIARRLDHPAYDCFYLALAERTATQVVTADGRLLARVAGTPWAAHVRDLASFAPPHPP